MSTVQSSVILHLSPQMLGMTNSKVSVGAADVCGFSGMEGNFEQRFVPYSFCFIK